MSSVEANRGTINGCSFVFQAIRRQSLKNQGLRLFEMKYQDIGVRNSGRRQM